MEMEEYTEFHKNIFWENPGKTRRNLPISLHLSPSLDSECFDPYTF